MAEYWVSIVKGFYPEDANRLRHTFLAKAEQHGIEIKTDEPARNDFRFRVGFNGDYNSFLGAVDRMPDMDASVTPPGDHGPRYMHDTVVITPVVRL